MLSKPYTEDWGLFIYLLVGYLTTISAYGDKTMVEWLVNNQLEVWREAAVAYDILLAFTWGTEQNHKKKNLQFPG